jgi:tetratricopeptide (TPR) repeat protein
MREQVCQRALLLYPKRPDLQGQILLAMGNDYLQQGKKEKAATSFNEAADKCIEVPDIVMAAADKLEKMFIDANHKERVIGLYADLYKKAPKVKVDLSIRMYASFYRLGKKLALALIDAGKEGEADALTKKLNAP